VDECDAPVDPIEDQESSEDGTQDRWDDQVRAAATEAVVASVDVATG
jgi:hypothetical protein